MRAIRSLVAAALAAAVVGCAPDGDAGRGVASAPSSPADRTGTTAVPSTPDPPFSARRTTPPPADPGRPAVSPPPSPSDGDRRGDLVRGVRTLRGTVERDGDQVLLRDGRGDTWALLGGQARRLATGADVEVRGTPTPPPDGCPAKSALNVTKIR